LPLVRHRVNNGQWQSWGDGPIATEQTTGRSLSHRPTAGSGGMGAVYKATDLRLSGKTWAIKEMRETGLSPAERAQAIHNFQGEAQMLANLHHPNLAHVSDFFQDTTSGRYYLVMDYIDGKTLEELLIERGSAFPEMQVNGWVSQLCDVLTYLHTQQPPIIFRDLKLGNIMLDNNTGQLKLIDFGIARFFKAGRPGDTLIIGTPGYSPPEQYGRGQTDARSDVYSLGATVHHLLTGQDPALVPFNLPPARQVNPNVSTRLESVIQKATQADPNDRYQTAQAFCQALTASTSSWLPWAGATALILIILALGVGLLLAQFEPGDDPTATRVAQLTGTSLSQTRLATADHTPTGPAGPSGDTATVPTSNTAPATLAPTLTSTTSPLPTPTSPPSSTPLPPPTIPPPPTPEPVNGRIVFDTTRHGGANEIYIMNPDGSNQQRLTSNSVQDDEPDLSPDGQWIAYDSFSGGTRQIKIMPASGGSSHSLVSGREPDWDPYGNLLAYETVNGTKQIRIVDVSSGSSWAITEDSHDNRAPSWSPDGSQIAMMSDIRDVWQIVIVDVETKAQDQITTGSGDKRFPVWSPNGDLIAYNTVIGNNYPNEIWMIDHSGNNAQQLTATNNNGRPAWSPDGQYILFNSQREGDWLIFQMDVDGTNVISLTTAGDDQRPDWGAK